MVRKLLWWAAGFGVVALTLGVSAYRAETAGPNRDQVAYDAAVAELDRLRAQESVLQAPDTTSDESRLRSLRAEVAAAELVLERRRDIERSDRNLARLMQTAPSGEDRLQRERAEARLADAQAAIPNYERALIDRFETWSARARQDSAAFARSLAEHSVASVSEFQERYVAAPFSDQRPRDSWHVRNLGLLTFLSFLSGCVALGLAALAGIAAFVIGIGRERRAWKEGST